MFIVAFYAFFEIVAKGNYGEVTFGLTNVMARIVGSEYALQAVLPNLSTTQVLHVLSSCMHSNGLLLTLM